VVLQQLPIVYNFRKQLNCVRVDWETINR